MRFLGPPLSVPGYTSLGYIIHYEKEIFHSLAPALSCFTCLKAWFGCAICGFLFFPACLPLKRWVSVTHLTPSFKADALLLLVLLKSVTSVGGVGCGVVFEQSVPAL